MLADLLLLSGNDIPFIEAQVVIHPPTLKEIGYLGEEIFYMGCSFLNFSKDRFLSEKDKVSLRDMSNFDVLMSIMKNGGKETRSSINNALMVLALIFPSYQISLDEQNIILTNNQEEKFYINNANYEAFKELLVEMFCLKTHTQEGEYNVKGDRAKMIAEKLKKGREKAAAAQNEKTKINILSRYASILAVGEKKDLNQLMHYTVYQLFDEFERFEMKESYDMFIKARLAGAKDLKEVDNWMEDLHP